LTPLLESVTVAQAALLAAIGEVLLTVYYAGALTFLPVALTTVAPGVVWAAYFFVLYRDRRGLRGGVSLRTATWITLTLGLGLQAFATVMTGWTLPGDVRGFVSWLLSMGWAMLLLGLAFAPDRPWTRRVALAMLILSAPSAVEEAYNGTWNNRGMLFWNDYPLEAFWRVIVIPAIRIFYALSQILFLWTLSRNPQRRDPIETLSAHLAP
jgi:hypothetical protein